MSFLEDLRNNTITAYEYNAKQIRLYEEIWNEYLDEVARLWLDDTLQSIKRRAQKGLFEVDGDKRVISVGSYFRAQTIWNFYLNNTEKLEAFREVWKLARGEELNIVGPPFELAPTVTTEEFTETRIVKKMLFFKSKEIIQYKLLKFELNQDLISLIERIEALAKENELELSSCYSELIILDSNPTKHLIEFHDFRHNDTEIKLYNRDGHYYSYNCGEIIISVKVVY